MGLDDHWIEAHFISGLSDSLPLSVVAEEPWAGEISGLLGPALAFQD
jgi:hypothetical protein